MSEEKMEEFNIEKDRHFKIKRVTKIADLVDGKEDIICTSDLSIEQDGHILQFDMVTPTEEEFSMPKIPVKPGIYDLEVVNNAIMPIPFEFKDEKLLKTYQNTERVLREYKIFFDKIHIYKELEIDPKRGILLYGPQGTGKTKSIIEASKIICEDDPGTVIINWKTDKLDADSVMTFFSKCVEYTEECTKVSIIIEDIGIGAEDYNGPKGIPSSLLNFLDGVGISFALPTFIIGTTNYPDNLPANLIDRPGRFDNWLSIGYPEPQERVDLLEFIGGKGLTDDEKEVVMSDRFAEYSAADFKEMVIRARLEETDIIGVADMIELHKALVKGDKILSGQITRKMGL